MWALEGRELVYEGTMMVCDGGGVSTMVAVWGGALNGGSDSFGVKVGLHGGLVMGSLLFI